MSCYDLLGRQPTWLARRPSTGQARPRRRGYPGPVIRGGLMAGRPAVRIGRVYDAPRDGDGRRILVDRLWPRGLAKEAAAIDEWLKAVAPSSELRRWYGHDPALFEEFGRRYGQELSV